MKIKSIELAKHLKKALVRYYGLRFTDLILFGSYARGDFNEESDIDFALLLNDNEISAAKEIINTAHLIAPINIKYNSVISILPISENRFQNSSLPIYQNIRREGIQI
jgi:predicted nucleotidyltransferase